MWHEPFSAAAIQELFLLMALCHDAIPDVNPQTGEVNLQVCTSACVCIHVLRMCVRACVGVCVGLLGACVWVCL